MRHSLDDSRYTDSGVVVPSASGFVGAELAFVSEVAGFEDQDEQLFELIDTESIWYRIFLELSDVENPQIVYGFELSDCKFLVTGGDSRWLISWF